MQTARQTDTDRQPDRQTDGQMEGDTDLPLHKAQAAWTAFPATDEARAWCAASHIHPLQPRFEISLYGREGALKCAQYWRLRCHHFLTYFLESGGVHPFVYPPHVAAEFREPPAFTDLTRSCLKPRAQNRFAELRALMPF